MKLLREETDPNNTPMVVMIRVKYYFENSVRQINALIILLVHYHRKIALNGGCDGKNGR